MMTKGPPGLLPIALAGYGGLVLWAAWQPLTGQDLAIEPASIGHAEGRQGRLILGIGLGTALAIGSILLAKEPILSVDGLTGIAAFGGIGLGLGVTAGRLVDRRRALSLFRALRSTHPLLVLGIPFLALALWGWAVGQRLGSTEVLQGTIRGETSDNLRPLVLASPLNNLEAALYAVGLGSVAALLVPIWLWRRRPILPAGWWMVVAWVLLGLAAFSTIGKGVPRYLTPLWPAIALAGGMWWAWQVQHVLAARRARGLVLAVGLGLGAGQAWWYAWGREHPPSLLERALGPRPAPSPRTFLSLLLDGSRPVHPDRLGTFEFDTPQIDYYVGRSVPAYVDVPPRPHIAIVEPRPITELVRRLRQEGGIYTLLVRSAQPRGFDPVPPLERLARYFDLEPLEIPARYTIDNGRTPVAAVIVRAKTNDRP